MDFSGIEWPLPDDIGEVLQYPEEIKFMSRLAATSIEGGVIHEDGTLEASPRHLAKALSLALSRLGITYSWVPYEVYLAEAQEWQAARERRAALAG